MRRTGLVTAALMVVLALAAGGCSRAERDAGEDRSAQTSQAEGQSDLLPRDAEPDETSPAAAARGVPVEESEDEDAPRIILAGLAYEWRVSPRRELRVKMTFENPNDLRGRARGFLIVVAASAAQGASSRVTYPTKASFEGEWPDDPTDGERLIFRGQETVEAVLPYGSGDEGYFDKLRVIVYDEDGDLSIDLGYDLEVTGEPTGEKTPKQVLSL